jgi:3-phenylpropionate/trans-cinnamate dioxygenase ferredoxin reductase component
MSPAHRIVVVGAGHSGGRVALNLRSNGFRGEIVVVGDEPDLPYERPPLSKEFLLSRGRERHAPLLAATGWSEADVRLQLETKAVGLHPSQHKLQLSDGTFLEYDQVVLATGAAPRELLISGSGLPGILPLRTVAHATELRSRLDSARHIAVVGGGVIGLEVAAAARQKGLEVSIIEAGDRLMARVAPPLISRWIASVHQRRGVHIYYGSSVHSIEPGGERGVRVSVRTAGTSLPELDVDLVVSAIGVSPCTHWLSGSGLPLLDGIVVDAFCRSPADSDCYAVGDVANTWHSRYGRPVRQETWRNAENQAQAVARILCGQIEPYVETPWMWSDQYDTNLQILGLPDVADAHIVRGDPLNGSFCWLGTRNGVLVSAALVNCGRERRALESMIDAGVSMDFTTLSDPHVALKRFSA